MNDNSFYSKYKYIKKLGHGGCADVFLAQNIVLGNLWAVKEIIKGERTSISGYIEPDILKRLNHPALPRICDTYEDENKIYIVEDYLEGTCLKKVLDEKGKFEEQTVIDWAIQLCSVLEYLHSQKPNAIIYGDMKPHNIILSKDGFVKLVDFGISAIIEGETDGAPRIEGETDRVSRNELGKNHNNYSEFNSINNRWEYDVNGKLHYISDNEEVCIASDNTAEYIKNNTALANKDETMLETEFIGTKGYAAPEQFIGNGISRASDIYSLGITIIQLATGLDPALSPNEFQNESYAGLLSPELYEILRRCVHANPKFRYKSVSILMQELKRYNLRNCVSIGNNVPQIRTLQGLTKILTITGARGTGISTITAAMAEYIARGPTSVCIVDLSVSANLETSIVNKASKLLDIRTNQPCQIFKVNSSLFYTNFNSNTEDIFSNNLVLQNQLSTLQEHFSYIILDADITLLKFIEHYSNYIFIVSDMNPFNLTYINQVMKIDSLAKNCISKTSFIINKFIAREISTCNILQSMLLTEDTSNELQELIIYAKVFEVPYEQKVYLKWIYSFFGELLNFSKSTSDEFSNAIHNIISQVILQTRDKQNRFPFKKLISKIVP